MNKTHTTTCLTAFFVGLLAIGWVGAGYVGTSPLALLMTALIGAVYVAGALELRRFSRATDSLRQALAGVPDALPDLGAWLARIDPALHNPVRLRIEGERVGLPGPAMTPYLVGLLVLLGMLGTFLGMVVTLNGAVLALESTTDLQTIRAALAAPVKGLGLAFGTSVAGVAASAMLGLMSALCRRDRLQAGQRLDSGIATALRGFSLTHQRQQTFKALQAQAQVLPEVAERLQAMMAQLEKHSQLLAERLLANQENHYRDARGLYSDLAASVDASLRTSLTESARLAGETIRPAVEATMDGLARQTTALHARLADTVGTQLDGLAGRFAATVSTVEDSWTAALARHERSSEHLERGLQTALTGYADSFEARSVALLTSVGQTHAALQAELAGSVTAVARDASRLHTALADTVGARLDGLASRFEGAVTRVADGWNDALARHAHSADALTRAAGEALDASATGFETRSAALLATVTEAHAAWRADAAAQDRQRLTEMSGTLAAMAASLQHAWQVAGDRTLAGQERLCRTLEETAGGLAAATQTQASRTIAEVTRLMETAAEAPRAAAEVIGRLRQELSASMARDNALLDERSRIMETLAALLDGINHASTEQRTAIDALVASSAALLERAGARFENRIGAESATLAEAAAQVAGGAIEVASLGDAFGLAVRLFGESNDKLLAGLQRIEGALGKSMTRSDEQLAYYVAQAREIIDLSITSQQQIVADLQQISGGPAAADGA